MCHSLNKNSLKIKSTVPLINIFSLQVFLQEKELDMMNKDEAKCLTWEGWRMENKDGEVFNVRRVKNGEYRWRSVYGEKVEEW